MHSIRVTIAVPGTAGVYQSVGDIATWTLDLLRTCSYRAYEVCVFARSMERLVPPIPRN